LFPMLK